MGGLLWCQFQFEIGFSNFPFADKFVSEIPLACQMEFFTSRKIVVCEIFLPRIITNIDKLDGEKDRLLSHEAMNSDEILFSMKG